MAGFDVDAQHVGAVPGVKLEFGEFTSSTDVTATVATTLVNVIGAVAICEATTSGWGYFDSVCNGKLSLGITCTSAAHTYNYIAWGF